MLRVKMNGVSEYAENYEVELVETDGHYDSSIPTKEQKGYGRWAIKAYNEGRGNCTEVDVVQLVKWLKEHRPDLLCLECTDDHEERK